MTLETIAPVANDPTIGLPLADGSAPASPELALPRDTPPDSERSGCRALSADRSASGTSRHGAPVRNRQRMPLIPLRSSTRGTPRGLLGNSGSMIAQSSSLNSAAAPNPRLSKVQSEILARRNPVYGDRPCCIPSLGRKPDQRREHATPPVAGRERKRQARLSAQTVNAVPGRVSAQRA